MPFHSHWLGSTHVLACTHKAIPSPNQLLCVLCCSYKKPRPVQIVFLLPMLMGCTMLETQHTHAVVVITTYLYSIVLDISNGTIVCITCRVCALGYVPGTYHTCMHASLYFRFLLCNQAMHPPVVSYRQHSSASQSSAIPMEEGEGEKPADGEGVESLIDSGNEERAKLSKVMSTEDEVARLTIEV